MNKSNMIYRDDSEYLNDMFTYLSLYLKEVKKNKGEADPEGSLRLQKNPKSYRDE